MNAPTKFPLDVEPAAPLGKPVPTPSDLEIVVRDRRFGRDKAPPRSQGRSDWSSSRTRPWLPMSGYVMTTTWPAYEGSVQTSW